MVPPDDASGTGGFTLIEVAAAFVVLALCVVALLQGSVILDHHTEIVELRAQGHQRAQSWADSVAELGYAALTPGTSVDTVFLDRRPALLTLTVSDEALRTRAVEVSIRALEGARPYASATTYAIRPW